MTAIEREPYEELALQEKERAERATSSSDRSRINEPVALLLATREVERHSNIMFKPTNSFTPINAPCPRVADMDTNVMPSLQGSIQELQAPIGSAISDQRMLIGISSTFFSIVETEKEDGTIYVYVVSVLKLPLGVYREHQESPIHFYPNMTAANNYLRHLCERRLNLDDPRSSYAHGISGDQGLWFERTDENGHGYRIFAKKRCIDIDRRHRKIRKEWSDPCAKIQHQLE
jgi:hypothetical protein